MDLKNLSKASPDELRDMIAQAKFLLDTKEEKSAAHGEAGYFYLVLADAIKSLTGAESMPYGVFLTTKYGSGFKAGYGIVERFVADNFKPQNLAETRQALRLMARCLVQWIYDRNIPAVMGTIADNLPNAPVALDDSFPGYAAAGMLPMIYKRAV